MLSYSLPAGPPRHFCDELLPAAFNLDPHCLDSPNASPANELRVACTRTRYSTLFGKVRSEILSDEGLEHLECKVDIYCACSRNWLSASSRSCCG